MEELRYTEREMRRGIILGALAGILVSIIVAFCIVITARPAHAAVKTSCAVTVERSGDLHTFTVSPMAVTGAVTYSVDYRVFNVLIDSSTYRDKPSYFRRYHRGIVKTARATRNGVVCSPYTIGNGDV